ncbi:MAG: methyltransferase domain-containing protein [Dehalococcoidales bacterium]|nr:methyltransferase domain-containing protein [Dehalococcoidales bacterium]
MSTTEKPYWEESYKRPGKLDTFGDGKPSKAVADTVVKIKLPAKAMDFGCGEGRNALYLAKLSFETSAVDISEAGIQKLKIMAKESNLNIDARVDDMRAYKFDKYFDLIVCTGCLHLIKREEWQKVLLDLKKYTSRGGFHVVGIFTDKVPEPEDQKGLMVGLFKEGELFTYYQDWEIIESKSSVFEDEHPGGIRHKHAANSITARKP